MPEHYKNCVDCGNHMIGIMAISGAAAPRTTCEACGGNDTEFHADNPHPKKWSLEQLQKLGIRFIGGNV